MIKMHINKAKTIEVSVSGIIPDIVSELILGIRTIKNEMNESAGEAFIETIKYGLDIIGEVEETLDSKDGIEGAINELVDKALEDDDFLETVMDAIPDELKSDFAKRMAKRASEKK